MKNILKKNQVIIAALAIMIIVAGYLNFTQGKVGDSFDDNSLDTLAQDGQITDDSTIANADVSPSASTSAEETLSNSEEEITDETSVDTSDEGNKLSANADEKDSTTANEVGEAVLASSSIGSDFFFSAKLQREQVRDKSKADLKTIIDNTNVSEEQKQSAIEEMIKLTTYADMENLTETLLEAKGFPEAVVTVLDDSVDVIVNANNLTDQQMAQIEDIVKRKTGISAQNIVISPVNVTEGNKDSASTTNATSAPTSAEEAEITE